VQATDRIRMHTYIATFTLRLMPTGGLRHLTQSLVYDPSFVEVTPRTLVAPQKPGATALAAPTAGVLVTDQARHYLSRLMES
jgi:hypothetical protein